MTPMWGHRGLQRGMGEVARVRSCLPVSRPSTMVSSVPASRCCSGRWSRSRPASRGQSHRKRLERLWTPCSFLSRSLSIAKRVTQLHFFLTLPRLFRFALLWKVIYPPPYPQNSTSRTLHRQGSCTASSRSSRSNEATKVPSFAASGPSRVCVCCCPVAERAIRIGVTLKTLRLHPEAACHLMESSLVPRRYRVPLRAVEKEEFGQDQHIQRKSTPRGEAAMNRPCQCCGGPTTEKSSPGNLGGVTKKYEDKLIRPRDS